MCDECNRIEWINVILTRHKWTVVKNFNSSSIFNKNFLWKLIWLYKIIFSKKPSKGSDESQPAAVVPDKLEKYSVIFTLKNQVGGLVRALQAFQDLGINVQHIESRPSQTGDNQVDFLVDIDCEAKKLEQVGRLLKREVLTMVIGSYGDQKQDSEFPPPTPLSATASFGEFWERK